MNESDMEEGRGQTKGNPVKHKMAYMTNKQLEDDSNSWYILG